ncbi:TPA: DUF3987 domain-containing protein [Providencia alcalifaciens]|nr:DUF3987 domain-containing protein [Providencia alcalifaciens]
MSNLTMMANQNSTNSTEYPVDAFPPVLNKLINSLHTETQIPVELIGSVTLGAVSLACQSLIEVIQPHTNMPEPCSLYLMTIAESGEGKTTINKLIMKPFYDFQSDLKKEYEINLASYNSNYDLWKVEQQALNSNLRKAIRKQSSGELEKTRIKEHKKSEPKHPKRLTLIYEDITLKALVEGLGEHPEAGIISDEAVTFFKGDLKNNPGLLNKAWDNELFDFRRADHEIYQIKPRLTFSLMSQPDIFNDYINKNINIARGSGFLSRFIFCNVSKNTSSSIVPINKNNKKYLSNFYERMKTLIDASKEKLKNGDESKVQFNISEEVLQRWNDYRNDIKLKTLENSEWEHIRDIALKASSNLLRISAILQYIAQEEPHEISNVALTNSINIINWHLEQACRIFYPKSERYQFEKDVRELYLWIKNRIEQNGGFAFPLNEIEKFGPNRLRRIDKLKPVLEQIISETNIEVAQFKPDSCYYVFYVSKERRIIYPKKFNNTSLCTDINRIQSRENTKGRGYKINLPDL